MPNWCSNSIKIAGDREEIDKILNKAKTEKSDFSLSQLFPIPELNKKNWYDWCVENWGTKWDLSSVDIDDQDDVVFVNCQTAWGSPLEAFHKISKDYPNLSFTITYDEQGINIFGVAEFQDGMNSDSTSEYDKQFGVKINFLMEQSFIKNEIITVPVEVTWKDDPYIIDDEFKTETWIFEMPNLLEVETETVEEGLNNSFIFKSSTETNIEAIIAEKSYAFAMSISENYMELKTAAQYNTLNKQIVKQKKPKSTKRKI
jgi:hypothetical protein